MDAGELKEQTEGIEEADRLSPFNKAIAIAVVMCAVFMAIAKVKDDNIVQAMQAAQVDKLDNWNYYQAKSTKQHLYEVQIEEWRLQAKISPPASGAAARALGDQVAQWEKEVAHFESDKKQTMAKAEQAGKDYDALNYRDDQFDLSDTLLGLAVALYALSSLIRSRWVFGIATGSAVFGMIMGLGGFFQWHIHPGFIRFLS